MRRGLHELDLPNPTGGHLARRHAVHRQRRRVLDQLQQSEHLPSVGVRTVHESDRAVRREVSEARLRSLQQFPLERDGLLRPTVRQAQWQGISPQQAQYSYPNPNPIGTGPFVADAQIYTQYQNQPAQPLHLFRNPNYHPVGTHTGPSPIDNIYLQQFQDEQTMAISLLGGDIDLAKMTSAGIGTVQNKPNVGWQEGLLSTQYWNEIGIEQSDPGNKNTPLNPA
ncbi:MAG: hypothetical protein E6J97_03960, partial [Methanobacteriota archaeon]